MDGTARPTPELRTAAAIAAQEELDLFSRLGLGDYSTPVIARWCARNAFFAAMRKVAAEEIERLQHSSLPLFSMAKRRAYRMARNSDYLQIVLCTIEPDGWQQELVTIRDWPALESVANRDSLLRDLRDTCWHWARQHCLTDPWFLNSLLVMLSAWTIDEQYRDALTWVYPSSLGGGESGGLSISGPGLNQNITYELDAPPLYDPLNHTRDDYMGCVKLYLDQQAAAAARAGFKPTLVKRNRSGSRSLHFEWLVRYQVQGWRQARIADEHTPRLSRVNTVADAVKTTAAQVGLTLRAHPPGRPRRRS